MIRSVSRNTVAMITGAVVTVVLAIALFVLPAVYFQSLRNILFETTGTWLSDNPLGWVVYVTGGFSGGITAFLSEGMWDDRTKNAAKATALGLFCLYAIVVVPNLVIAVLNRPLADVPFLSIVVIPLFFTVIPLGGVFLIESVLAGATISIMLR